MKGVMYDGEFYRSVKYFVDAFNIVTDYYVRKRLSAESSFKYRGKILRYATDEENENIEYIEKEQATKKEEPKKTRLPVNPGKRMSLLSGHTVSQVSSIWRDGV